MLVVAKNKRVRRKLANAKASKASATSKSSKQETSPSPPKTSTGTVYRPPRAQSGDIESPTPYTASCPPNHRRPFEPAKLWQRPDRTEAISCSSVNAPLLQLPSWVLERVARSSEDVLTSHKHDVLSTSCQPQSMSIEGQIHGALCHRISLKLDSVITSIDGEVFGGDDEDLVIPEESQSGLRGGGGPASRGLTCGANIAISSAIIRTNYFAKAGLYANSRLPPNLPPLKIYMPSFPLLCLAAQYSQRAYNRPSGKESDAFVNADWRMGTKAMVIKSVPLDDMNCIVFAIRGSQTFMDWAVNLNSAPMSPSNFLDDPGNLVHSGFLSVARKMIKPVAARLRSLLEENPSRSTCSLLMTGHSAGGAVASLLYSHMLAEDVGSELNVMTGCFKRIHCLTFGTPPISLLPLTKPSTLRHKKSLFMSFINEGDPVPRADKAYILSLLNLYASPSPNMKRMGATPPPKSCKKLRIKSQTNPNIAAPLSAPVWRVPAGILSNAGRLVVLRDSQHQTAQVTDDVKAEITSDQELRAVVFGNPVMHMMKVYARRIEVLATKAVTAQIWG